MGENFLGMGIFECAALIRAAEGLRLQLDEAHRQIEELRGKLAGKIACNIAEKSFGYEEPTRPHARWISEKDPIAVGHTFKKTNTVVLTASHAITNDLLEMHCAGKGRLERVLKETAMDSLWCQMQEAGIFRSYQTKGQWSTVFVIAVEVAK